MSIQLIIIIIYFILTVVIGLMSGRKTKLPLTGVGVVDYVVTEKCVFHFTKEGMVLEELAPGETVESIKAITDCDIIVPDVIKSME